jgi:hypothetical protein
MLKDAKERVWRRFRPCLGVESLATEQPESSFTTSNLVSRVARSRVSTSIGVQGL